MAPRLVRAIGAVGMVSLVGGGLAACQGPQVRTGTVTDDVCGAAGHAGMQMGPTDAECTRLCVLSHGALYVLLVDENGDGDGDTVYGLSDQAAAEPFAGLRVSVAGALDAATSTIGVTSIALTE